MATGSLQERVGVSWLLDKVMSPTAAAALIKPGMVLGFSGFASGAPANANISATVDIDLYTALLGGDIILQTRGGRLKLHVKPCTQNGAKVRLRGKGYHRGDGTYGDLILTYNVKLPAQLNDRQRQLLEEMRQAGN